MTIIYFIEGPSVSGRAICVKIKNRSKKWEKKKIKGSSFI
ncbi:hypothetical protein BSV1_I26 (plasmid) [Borreliella finlandensis]|uniref:Uncharacterized protein n=1 Tax=Borreliella finlandensis TaxID=498741 RepID=A0A806C6X8_9SPIR|nr:hypothetical protein BSV1_I26 [Borreliella finlandensis]